MNPSPILLDFRHVYEKPAEADKTESQKSIRSFKDKSFKMFMTELRALEKENLEGCQVPEKKAASAGKDEGTARVLELVDRLQAEFGQRKAPRPPRSRQGGLPKANGSGPDHS